MMQLDAYRRSELHEPFTKGWSRGFERCANVGQKWAIGHASEGGNGQEKCIPSNRLHDSSHRGRGSRVFSQGGSVERRGTQRRMVEKRCEFFPRNLGAKRIEAFERC